MVLSTVSALVGLGILALWFAGCILFFTKVFPSLWEWAVNKEAELEARAAQRKKEKKVA